MVRYSDLLSHVTSLSVHKRAQQSQMSVAAQPEVLLEVLIGKEDSQPVKTWPWALHQGENQAWNIRHARGCGEEGAECRALQVGWADLCPFWGKSQGFLLWTAPWCRGLNGCPCHGSADIKRSLLVDMWMFRKYKYPSMTRNFKNLHL